MVYSGANIHAAWVRLNSYDDNMLQRQPRHVFAMSSRVGEQRLVWNAGYL